MKLKTGDFLYDPMSLNTGEIKRIYDHPDGKIVLVRWQVPDHLSHESEHLYNKILKSIKKGEIRHTPG